MMKPTPLLQLASGILLFLLGGCSIIGVGNADSYSIPEEPIILEINHLNKIKTQINTQGSVYSSLYKELIQHADSILSLPEPSVIYQPNFIEESSIHDYNSLSIYYWPNPNTADGLPYIHRAGSNNPEAQNYDQKALKQLHQYIKVLSLAGYFTDNTKYYNKVTEIVETWFWNKETYMNPNFKYGQSIPGRSYTTMGLIEAVSLGYILDYLILINTQIKLSTELKSNLVEWYRLFNNWIKYHSMGKSFKNSEHNIGSYHDVLFTYINHFTGNKKDIKRLLETTTKNRIEKQINSKGVQVFAVERPDSWGYSTYNLNALTLLATYAEKFDLNLWTSGNSDGNIVKAIKMLLDSVESDKWSYYQNKPINPCSLYAIVARLNNANVQINFDNQAQRFLIENKTQCATFNYFSLPVLPTR